MNNLKTWLLLCWIPTRQNEPLILLEGLHNQYHFLLQSDYAKFSSLAVRWDMGLEHRIIFLPNKIDKLLFIHKGWVSLKYNFIKKRGKFSLSSICSILSTEGEGNLFPKYKYSSGGFIRVNTATFSIVVHLIQFWKKLGKFSSVPLKLSTVLFATQRDWAVFCLLHFLLKYFHFCSETLTNLTLTDQKPYKFVF